MEHFYKNQSFIVASVDPVPGAENLFNTGLKSIHRPTMCLKIPFCSTTKYIRYHWWSLNIKTEVRINKHGKHKWIFSTSFNAVEICPALCLWILVAFLSHPMCQTFIAEMIWLSQAENDFHFYIAALFSITNKMWLLPIEMYLM